MVLPTVPDNAVIERQANGSASSYNLGAGAVWNDPTVPGVAYGTLQRGRMASRVGVRIRLESGRVVIEIDKGSEVDLDVLVNDVPHRFPPSNDRSLPERLYRPNGE